MRFRADAAARGAALVGSVYPCTSVTRRIARGACIALRTRCTSRYALDFGVFVASEWRRWCSAPCETAIGNGFELSTIQCKTTTCT